MGGLLAAAGLAVLATGGFALPTRQPGGEIRFDGAAWALAGLAPLLVGAGLWALGSRPPRDGLGQLAVATGIVAAVMSFLLAQGG